MRVDVVGHDQVGWAVLGARGGPRLRVEECRQRGHTNLPSRFPDVSRGLDPEASDPVPDGVLVPVIARHFDQEGVAAEQQPANGVVHEVLRVLHQDVENEEKYAYSVKVSSGVISGGTCASRHASQTRTWSGQVGSGSSR